MVKFLKINLLLIVTFISVFLFSSCAEDPAPSLWQDPPSGLKPVVNSISPDEPLGGVSIVTIAGSNFSATPHYNNVTFNGVAGQVISASPNELQVRAPAIANDTVFVLVSVVNSVPTSDTVTYRVLPALAEMKRDAEGTDLFTADLEPNGLTTDAQGNLYVSVTEFNASAGVKKITPSGIIVPFGTLQDFAPSGGSGGTLFHKLNMFQNATIIGARKVAAIFQIVEGATASVFASGGMSNANDIDTDVNLNIWVGASSSPTQSATLFRVTPAKEVKSFPFPGNINSIRIFNDHLYVLTTINLEDAIYRIPIISGDSIGTAEEFFNISQSVEQNQGTSTVTGTDFDISADGDLIVGTSRVIDPIVVVHQDGTFETLYPGIIPNNTLVFAFAWGSDKYLYFTRQATGDILQTLMRLDMQRQGAPYYGR